MSRNMRILAIAIGIVAVVGIAGVIVIPGLLEQAGVNVPVGSAGPVELALPAGFRSAIFARGLDQPRFMAYGPGGTLFVAERGAGRVVALPDHNGDGTADEIVVVAQGLDAPSSLAFYQGWLYVGETSRISRLQIGADLGASELEVVVPNLPTGGAHTTRTVLLSPEGRLFVSVGSSCNVCDEEDGRRAAISAYDASGRGGRVFARGLRNAVGLAINPWTGELWATNNGADWLGDDRPPETVYIVREGADYGWPRCHSGSVPDPDLGGAGACQGVAQPAITMQAHSAPLGLAFYDADRFPAEYQGDLYVAFHGSWNRSVPTGYKIVRIPLEDGTRPTGRVVDFATGWLRDDGSVPGRPAGLVVAPDGSLMVSDDKAGLIYRIGYGEE